MRSRTSHSSVEWFGLVRRACLAAGARPGSAKFVAQVESLYRGNTEATFSARWLAGELGLDEKTARTAISDAVDRAFWERQSVPGRCFQITFKSTAQLLSGSPSDWWTEGLEALPKREKEAETPGVTPAVPRASDPDRARDPGSPRARGPQYPGRDARSTPGVRPGVEIDPGREARGGPGVGPGGCGSDARTKQQRSRIDKQQQHPQSTSRSLDGGSARDPGAAAAAAAAEAPPREPDRDALGELIRSGLAAIGVDPGSPFGAEVAEALAALELPDGVTRPVAVERILDRARSQANPGGGLRSAIGGGYLADWAEDPAEREDPRQASDPHAAPAKAEASVPSGWDIELERLACEFVFQHTDPRAAEAARRGAELRARRSEWGSVDGVLFAQESQIQALSEHVEPQVHAGWGIDGWRRWLRKRAQERGGEPSATLEASEPEGAAERDSGGERDLAAGPLESAPSLNGHGRNGAHVEPSAAEHDPFAGVGSKGAADADSPWSYDASESAFDTEEREPDYMRALREGLER